MTVRVLHLVTSTQRRGAEIFATRLSGFLAEEGLLSDVVAISAPDAGAVLDIATLAPRRNEAAKLAVLRRAMRGADVVVAHGSRSLPYSVIAGLGVRVPIIYKSIGDPWYWADTPWRRRRTTALLSRVHAVAALSSGAAKSIEECWGVPASKITVTGNGRDIMAFHPPTHAQRLAARGSLDIDPTETVVLVLGALTREKRPDLALKVAGRVGDATFLIAGDGPLRGLLENSIENPERIRLLGASEDVVGLLHAADVFLSTSDSEGLSGALVEAALCGLPTVATRAGFTSDVVIDGVTGILTDLGNEDALAAGIRTAIDMAHGMAEAARAHAVSTFDERAVFDRWKQLVETVARASG